MKKYIKSAGTSNANSKFNQAQLEQIELGRESGVDVSMYADPRYDYYQMDEIREGLESGVDVSWYADPRYSASKMDEILIGLEKGLDVSWYADPKYDAWQMDQIRKGLESGVDVSTYADPMFDGYKMMEIRESLESGPESYAADVSTSAPSSQNKITTKAQMTKIILENDWITSAIEWANDMDYGWEYNTPDSFTDFVEEQFEARLPEWLEDSGYVCDDPLSLVSDEIWVKLQDQAMSGDFPEQDEDEDW